MRKIYYLLILLLTAALISSCDTTNDPGPVNGNTGSILIQSTPAGAQIWVNGTNTTKTTPDSVTGLATGTVNVTLRLNNYRDTTFTMNVVANQQTVRSVTLTSSVTTTKYGPVRIYETANTTVNQPSGLDLSSGMAYGISGNQRDSVDIYYSSTGYIIVSADVAQGLNRTTAFFVGAGTNLDDGVDAPLAVPSWTDRIVDTQSNYVFLFDTDLHYSKMKIVNRGGGTGIGNPAWVEIEWIYNETVNDRNF